MSAVPDPQYWERKVPEKLVAVWVQTSVCNHPVCVLATNDPLKAAAYVMQVKSSAKAGGRITKSNGVGFTAFAHGEPEVQVWMEKNLKTAPPIPWLAAFSGSGRP